MRINWGVTWELVEMKDLVIFTGCASIWAVPFLHIFESQFWNVKPKKAPKNNFFLSCDCGSPSVNYVFSFRLRPIWGVKTLCVPSHQFDWSAANRERGGVSATVPKPQQVQSFHIHWGQIPAGNWWTRSPVLPVEAVHLKGDNIPNITSHKTFCTRCLALQWTAPLQ